jgi:hypothetical protein
MAQSVEKLRATLHELERELAQVKSLDAESRRLLEAAAAEIHEALAQQPQQKIQPQTWTERLSAATQEFEESHPTLSRLVGNVVDALAHLGI